MHNFNISQVIGARTWEKVVGSRWVDLQLEDCLSKQDDAVHNFNTSQVTGARDR